MYAMTPKNAEGDIAWFAGDADGLQIFRLLVDLLHTWDDLVDRDKPVTESGINAAFMVCLIGLPSNPVYREIQDSAIPVWLSIVSAYETANRFEATQDAHGLEIGHTLRYAAGQIVALAMIECCGYEVAKTHMPAMWKACVFERFDNYKKEHTA